MGPTVGVLLPATAWSAEQAVAASVEKVGLHPADDDLSAYAPKFRESLPQLRDRDDLPYDLEVKEWSAEPDPEFSAAIETAIGIRPAQVVELYALVSDLQAHRVLGEFAADLAVRTKGWIMLGGPLCPRRWSPSRDWTPSKIRPYVAKLALPGEVLSVERETECSSREERVTTAFVADERPTSSSAGAGTMFSAVLADAISCKGKTGMIG